jgi:hypothetical protein
MHDDRLIVNVTFDEKRGYVATAPELRVAVVALSLGGLRRRIEALMVPDNVDVKLILDRSARRERDRTAAPRPRARAPRPYACGQVHVVNRPTGRTLGDERPLSPRWPGVTGRYHPAARH